MFSTEELERYARHIVLHEIGGPGQAALKRARVLVIGAGGLGAPALVYLAAAGLGAIGVIDDDKVALSNLQRQVIHATSDIGGLKVESAASAIRHLNPHVAVEPHAARLTAANALALIQSYDVVADGSDNFVTRYLVSDACFLAKKPLITGRSAFSTARSLPCAPMSEAAMACPIQPIAACSRSRHRLGRFRLAPKPGFSVRSPACWAR